MLLHSALGAVLSSMSGGSIASGALGAGANEALQKELGNIDNPELHKLASALIGGLAGNSSAKTGAAIAMSGTEYNFIPHEDQQYFLKDIEAFYKGNITREQFIDKLKYYVALDLYYTHIGNSDNISGDLKDGGNWFIASQLDRNSLTDIFAGEGIGTTSGFSTALYEFAKMYGVAYEYSPEIAEIIDTRIAPFRGTYVPKSESDIGGLVQSGVSQPTVVWEGYQASDGLIYEKLSDGTIRKTDRYMGSEKLKEGYPAIMGADGAWYADGFWIPNQDLTLSQDIASDVKKTFDEQGEVIATGLSGSAIGIGKFKNNVNTERGIGGKGWKGDKLWKENVNMVQKGGTIEKINDTIVTQKEAMELIRESGGKILRIEEGHPAGGNSPHTYPHINYVTENGKKGTIRIKEVN